MKGKKVRYNANVYEVTEWVHYRLEWFEVELKDHNGYYSRLLRESDLELIKAHNKEEKK